MASNPFVQLGSLNKLLANVKFTTNPGLNIPAQYMSLDGLRVGFEGQAATPIDVMMGVVPSGNPYIRVTLRFGVVKSLAIANAWKQQLESAAQVGDFVVRPDVAGFAAFDFSNGFILNPEELVLNGSDASFRLSLCATYYINSSLFP